jgi:hypothetical protein
MHFYIDRALSQYCGLARCVCSCIGFPTILGTILSDKPTFLTIMYFPDRVTGNFKRFDTPLALLALTMPLPSNLMREIGATVSDSIKRSILHCDVDRQKQLQ